MELEEAAGLVWHGEPFVVAEGADVRRALTVDLAAAATVTMRETLVLGRSGEGPGRLTTRTDLTREGSPVLVEELDSATGLGPHRVLDQVLRLGSAAGPGEHTMLLESGDALDRWLGAETHASPLRLPHSSARPE